MPSIEVLVKGQNSYVKLTDDDGRTEWIRYETPVAAAEAAEAIQAGEVDRETITLGQFFDRFMTHHAMPNLKDDTVSNYLRVFDGQVRGVLSNFKLTELSLREVELLVESLRKAGKSNRQIASILNILSSILGRAVKWKYIGANPMDHFDAILIGNAPK